MRTPPCLARRRVASVQAVNITAALLLLLLAASPVSIAPPDVDGRSGDDGFEVEARDEDAGGSGTNSLGGEHTYLRADLVPCNFANFTVTDGQYWLTGMCRTPALRDAAGCSPDEHWRAALWRVVPGTAIPKSLIERVSRGRCVARDDLASTARKALAQMPIAPPPVVITTGPLPALLVGARYPAHTVATSTRMRARLLGVSVDIRATPLKFLWDFDANGESSDQSQLATTDAGRPWQPGDPPPDEEWVSNVWRHPGNYRVTMTTTWRGEFRRDGGEWQPIDGEVTTVSEAGWFVVVGARSLLVCDDLAGGSVC